MTRIAIFAALGVGLLILLELRQIRRMISAHAHAVRILAEEENAN